MPTLGRQMNYFVIAQRTQNDEFALQLRKSIDPHLVIYCTIVTVEKRSLSAAIEYAIIDFSSDESHLNRKIRIPDFEIH